MNISINLWQNLFLVCL